MAAVSTVVDTFVSATGLAVVFEPELVDEVRVLGQQPALQLVALLARHRGDIERVDVDGLFVELLLQLPPVNELHVTDRGTSSLSWLAGLDPGPQSGEHVGPVVVERECGYPRDPLTESQT